MTTYDPIDEAMMDGLKERHGCVTAWLVFAFVVTGLSALFYFFAYDKMLAMAEENPEVQIPNVNPTVMGVLSLLQIAFIALLWQWKKVGFWGLVALSLAGLVLNLMSGASPAGPIFGTVFALAIWYGILQIKKNGKSTWEQLE